MNLCVFFCEIRVRFLLLYPGHLFTGEAVSLSSTSCHLAPRETLTFGGVVAQGTRTPHGPGGAARLLRAVHTARVTTEILLLFSEADWETEKRRCWS